MKVPTVVRLHRFVKLPVLEEKALVEAFSVIAKTDGLFAALNKSQEQEIGVLFVGFGFLFLGC